MSPIVSGFVTGTIVPKIALYRENESKIYAPRFFAQHRYGIPRKNTLSPGDDITSRFVGKLRPDQQKVVDIYKSHLFQRTGEYEGSLSGGGVLEVRCGGGKTVNGIYIATEIVKKKTLVVVHKDFLADQWVDRIREYAPTARVGRIQGQIFDIEDKDFVIVMIQTIYSKTYPIGTFASFGLTIIDEAHRVCSTEFFKVMQQIITPCMLGLSATVDKQNGLECILHNFVGDKVFKGEIEVLPITVTVHAIEFRHDDLEYNEVERDYQGRVKYSQLTSKISSFEPRIKFIIRVLSDMLIENPSGQIIVLALTRQLLNDICDGIDVMNETENRLITRGFYVGGMKQDALAETELRQIVLATYAMAAEALDIKTLDSLAMVTPKLDILQSMGRILRELTRKKTIVDITDTHDTFKNQSKKRRAIYKKQGYHVYSTNSDAYQGMGSKTPWKRVYVPAGVPNEIKCVESPENDYDEEEPDNEPEYNSLGCLF